LTHTVYSPRDRANACKNRPSNSDKPNNSNSEFSDNLLVIAYMLLANKQKTRNW